MHRVKKRTVDDPYTYVLPAFQSRESEVVILALGSTRKVE